MLFFFVFSPSGYLLPQRVHDFTRHSVDQTNVAIYVCVSYLCVTVSLCQRVYLSPCLCVTVSMCLRASVSLCLCVTVSTCLRFSVSPCLCVTVSLCHCVSVSPCQCVTMPICRRVCVSPCLCVTVSVCILCDFNFADLNLCRFPFLSLSASLSI